MAMVEDPVCGMRIDSEEAAGTLGYEGKKIGRASCRERV